MAIGKAIQMLRTNKKALYELKQGDPAEMTLVERRALTYLNNYDSYSKLTKDEEIKTANREESGRKRVRDPIMSLEDVHNLSAYRAGVRSSETQQSKALRTYSSKSPLIMQSQINGRIKLKQKQGEGEIKDGDDQANRILKLLCAEADECARLLRKENPGIVEAVLSYMEKANSQSADESG